MWWYRFEQALADFTQAITGWTRLLWQILCTVPPRFTVIVLCATIGLPLSHYGFVWKQFKGVKQLADCRTDVYIDVANAVALPTANKQANAIEQAGNRLGNCIGTADPNIGALRFLEQQRARVRAGRP